MQRTIENFARLNDMEQTKVLSQLDLSTVSSWIDSTKIIQKKIELQLDLINTTIQQLDKQLKDDKLFIMSGIYIDTATERHNAINEYNLLVKRFNRLHDCLRLFIYHKNNLIMKNKDQIRVDALPAENVGLFKQKNNSQLISSNSHPTTTMLHP